MSYLRIGTSSIRLSILLIVYLLSFTNSVFADSSQYKKYSTAKLVKIANVKNDTEAQYLLGYRYEIGLKVKRSYSNAIKWYKKAARKKHRDAQYRIGVLYYKKKSYTKARYWLMKRAKNGHADAQYYLANIYRYALDVREQTTVARQWYTRAAKQGHNKAQYELGLQFQKGIGAKRNANTAKKWLKEAAKHGNKKAKAILAINNAANSKKTPSKRGPKKTARASTKLTQHARQNNQFRSLLDGALLGNSEQQYELGMRYLLGYKIPIDLPQAINWLSKAAKQDHDLAQYQIANQYLAGNNTKRNIDLSIHYYAAAAKHGVLAATMALTYLSKNGFQTIVNAEQGDEVAQYQLAINYLNSRDRLKQIKGLLWLRASAKQLYPLALLKLGCIYNNGNILDKNKTTAFQLIAKAAELNNADAQWQLSKMYKQGLGTAQDLSKAARWLSRAASQGHKEAQKMLQFSEI